MFPGKKFCGLLNCVFKFALSEESLPRDRSLQLTTCRGFYLMVEDGWFLETIPSDLLPRLKHLRLSFLSNQSSSRHLSVCRKKIYLALNLMSTSLSLCNMKFSFGKENLWWVILHVNCKSIKHRTLVLYSVMVGELSYLWIISKNRFIF